MKDAKPFINGEHETRILTEADFDAAVLAAIADAGEDGIPEYPESVDLARRVQFSFLSADEKRKRIEGAITRLVESGKVCRERRNGTNGITVVLKAVTDQAQETEE